MYEGISRSGCRSGLRPRLRRSFEDQAGEIEGQGQGIADEHGLGGVLEAEPGRTFDAAAFLNGISALRVTLTANAQVPGIGADLHVACQAGAAIRQAEANGEGVAHRMIEIDVLAGLASRRRNGLIREPNVWIRLVSAFLAANPLGRAVVVIMAVAEKAIAQRAEGIAMLLIAAFEAGEGLVIAVHGEQADGAQGFQVIVDVAQDLLVAFARISQQFADLQSRETAAQLLETGDGKQVIINVGWGAGTGEGPEQKEAVIDEVEGFGFVAETVFALGLGRLLCLGAACFRRIGVRAWAVRAGVVDVSGIRVAGSGEATVFPASLGIAGAAFLVSFPSRAGAG